MNSAALRSPGATVGDAPPSPARRASRNNPDREIACLRTSPERSVERDRRRENLRGDLLHLQRHIARCHDRREFGEQRCKTILARRGESASRWRTRPAGFGLGRSRTSQRFAQVRSWLRCAATSASVGRWLRRSSLRSQAQQDARERGPRYDLRWRRRPLPAPTITQGCIACPRTASDMSREQGDSVLTSMTLSATASRTVVASMNSSTRASINCPGVIACFCDPVCVFNATTAGETTRSTALSWLRWTTRESDDPKLRQQRKERVKAALHH